MPKLTIYQRNSIRHAIMSDVPEVNYFEQMLKRAQEVAVSLLPTEVQRLWKNAATRGYLRSFTIYLDCVSLRVPGDDGGDAKTKIVNDPELVRLHQLHDAQREARAELNGKLRRGLAAASTTKQFAEAFPDLVRYLPAESQPAANLPASTEVMDALREAGFKSEAA